MICMCFEAEFVARIGITIIPNFQNATQSHRLCSSSFDNLWPILVNKLATTRVTPIASLRAYTSPAIPTIDCVYMDVNTYGG